MKKLSILYAPALALCACFCTSAATAQWLSVPPVGNSQLMSVSFGDPNTVYCAGFLGNDTSTILKSSNAGESFTALNASFLAASNVQVTSVSFTDANTGYLAGFIISSGNGVIYKTSNGGASWTMVLNPVAGLAIYSLSFPTAQTGYAIASNYTGFPGNYIYKTSDYGATWTQIYGSTDVSLSGHYFFDANTAIFTGTQAGPTTSRAVVIKISGGAVTDSIFPAGYQSMSGIAFTSATTGFALAADGATHILKTTDGGSTWTAVYNLFSSPLAGNIVFANPANGYVTGSVQAMTSDGGATWSSFSLPASPDIFDMAFSNNVGIALGDYGAIFRTAQLSAVAGVATATDKVTVYPNPSGGIFSFSANGTIIGSVTVYNILGQAVLAANYASGSAAVDLSTLPDGTYFAQVRDAGGAAVQTCRLTKAN